MVLSEYDISSPKIDNMQQLISQVENQLQEKESLDAINEEAKSLKNDLVTQLEGSNLKDSDIKNISTFIDTILKSWLDEFNVA